MRTWQQMIPIAAVVATVFLADDAFAQRKKSRVQVDPESFEGLKASYAKIRGRLKKAAGKKAGGKRGGSAAPSRRESAAIAAARPVVEKIADLKTDPALSFLVAELKTGPGALKPLLAQSAVRTGAAGLVEALFRGFAKQKGDTQEAILAAAKNAPDRRPFAESALPIAASVKSSAGKRHLATLLGSAPGIETARALVALLPEKDAGDSADSPLAEAVLRPLLLCCDDESTAQWAREEAFSGGKKMSSTQAIVWMGLVGALDIRGARKRVARAASHPDEAVSIAAAAALVQLAGKNGSREISRLLRGRKGNDLVSYRVRLFDAIGRAANKAGVAILVKLAKVKDVDARAVVMGSLALAARFPSALDGIAGGLLDKHPYVRAAALRSLESLTAAGQKHKRVIGALIEHLARERQHRLRVDSLGLLVDLSGQNMGFEVADWRKWWNEESSRFGFAAPGEKKSTLVVQNDLSYFGIEIASKRIAFLLDVSNSMLSAARGEKARKLKLSKLDVMKRELAGVVEKLSANAAINILIFDKRIRYWEERLTVLKPAVRKKALHYVKNLPTGGGTNIFDTIELSLRDPHVDTIYLLTDGQATTGRFKDGPGMVKGLRDLNRARGVTVHCIAFGRECEWMREAAAENGGQYRYVAE